MTKIEWTGETWNPVVGCSRASAGCDNCYAVQMTHRLEKMAEADAAHGRNPGKKDNYRGLTVLNPRGDRHFNGVVRCVEEALTIPLRWRKARTVFVNSMADLFHPKVPFEFIDRVFAVMALCPQHTFQVLTKRPERMAEYLNAEDAERLRAVFGAADGLSNSRPGTALEWHVRKVCSANGSPLRWPLPNVWLGTSCENRAAADERIPHLLRCPAAVRFLSCEPLLGPVALPVVHDSGEDMGEDERRECGLPATVMGGDGASIDWVIVGGESGKNARPCDVAWIRSIVRQCGAAQVPCFVKQLGAVVWDRNDAGFDGDPDDAWDYAKIVDVEFHPDGDATVYQGAPVRVRLHDTKGGDMAEWPEDLRVRQMPQRGQER